MVHAGIETVANGSDFPYPSPDGAVKKYQKVGEAIINSIHANNFNTETYRFVVIVYKPGSDPEEVCLMTHNNDVVQGTYRNVNYLVSRVEAQLTSILSSRIVQDNATIRASFGVSSKKNLCERTRDVEAELKYEFTGEGGFRTMLVTKCARKFVWYELAWQQFRAAWSSSHRYNEHLEIFATNGNYDKQCVSIVLIP
ncbi:hypothetical protein AAVH_37756 [Aphelenchoides avenae]|nr:hypothetical protein AAVH_37756 [Aphelenchus avenae]